MGRCHQVHHAADPRGSQPQWAHRKVGYAIEGTRRWSRRPSLRRTPTSDASWPRSASLASMISMSPSASLACERWRVRSGRRAAVLRVYREEEAVRVMQQAEIAVQVDLARGSATATLWSCDFSYDYVKINADYRSWVSWAFAPPAGGRAAFWLRPVLCPSPLAGCRSRSSSCSGPGGGRGVALLRRGSRASGGVREPP